MFFWTTIFNRSRLPEDYSSTAKSSASVSSSKVNTHAPVTAAVSSMTKVHSKSNGVFPTAAMKHENPHSVLLMDAFSPPTANDVQASSRRPLLPRQPPIGGTDRDENKYKRRTPAEIFARWSRRFYAPSSRPPWRRTWFLVLSGITAFIVIIYIMAVLGRSGSDDALGDAWNNPNPNPKHYE
ncbi:zinc finger protein-like 1 homolog [Teleopsis dalmanni]|uniref:zinc finger protein-like 1 homolog n=1 Tax=Teleopsis dalmanni TaxID=139649 RepID=UPI0018CF5DB3|nr:zinc finger protein-like 1 homolog [Teleopsis dalmanni]